MDELLAIAQRSGCTKLGHPHYMPLYAKYFGPHRNQIEAVLELGVGDGSSLRMWEEWFPKARITGVDINIGDQPPLGSRIGVWWFDQSDEPMLSDLAAILAPWDLIIDDAGHDPRKQWASLNLLWSHVRPGGCYVIEDLESSYWPWMEGVHEEGEPRPQPDVNGYGCSWSMIERLKLLIDGLNEPYIQKSHQDRLVRLPGLASIHLYPNIAFLWRE